MRMIFVNLPIKNLARSVEFFTAIGMTFNAQFTSEDSTCMVMEENIMAMLMEEPRFKTFINGEISDTSKSTEVLLCLSCDSREEVDDTLGKALAAGGKPWKPTQDHGFMYGASFQDLDGHVWELVWMDPAAVMPTQ